MIQMVMRWPFDAIRWPSGEPFGVTLELIGAHVGSHLDSEGYLRGPKDATLAHIWRYFGISFATLDRFVCHTLIVWYFMGDMHSFSMYYVIIVLFCYFGVS